MPVQWFSTCVLRAASRFLSCRKANAPLPGGLDFLKGAGPALSLFSVPRARGEAERRQALVRNAAPGGPPCGRADPWIARDHRPMTQAGAPLGAPPRRFPSGARAALSTAGGWVFAQALQPSASSWQGAVVPPGGAPAPPECVVCETTPAGAAPAEARDFPRRRPPKGEKPVLRPLLSVRPASTTPREAPLSGRR